MEFRIADTFTESLARLTNEEQKAVKMTAFDLQLDPSSPLKRRNLLMSSVQISLIIIFCCVSISHIVLSFSFLQCIDTLFFFKSLF